MKGRALTGLLLVLGVSLGMVLLMGERTVSKFMESCGQIISDSLGL